MLKRTLTLAAAFAVLAPAVASAQGDLALIDKTEPVGPGISLRHLKTVDAAGWYDHQILSVDLANPAVKSDSLWKGAVAAGGPLTESANKAGAVAGVNADFFDIGNSTAAEGGQILGGTLLKSPNGGTGWNHVGVGKDGIGRLVDLTLEASASLKGASHKVVTLNAANPGGVAANSMIAFTSAWGTYARNRGLLGVTDVAEVLVQDNKVVSVNATGAGAGEIPTNGFVLVGREAAAAAIRALAPGDDVTLAYGLKDDIAKNLQWGVGGNQPLVRDGAALPELDRDTSVHPRTAIGFKDGGKTMLLVTADGRQAPVLGVTFTQLARTFVKLGAETALNLDGGGSTTMVARALGDSGVTVRNSPSDGFERHDPNGVGVFVTPGSGTVDELIVTPEEPRVFPGLGRTLTVKAVDDHDTPVAPGDVAWTGAPNGRVVAPDDAAGKLTVKATSGSVSTEKDIRVLGKLKSLELSSTRLAFADATPADAKNLRVTGRDAQGFAAPVELADLDLSYDQSLLKIEQNGDVLKLTPLKAGGTVLVAKAAGEEIKLAITIGVITTTAYTFDHENELSLWNPNGTDPATESLSMQDGRLKLTYKGKRNMGIAWKTAATRVTLPGQPLKIRLRMYSEQALQYAYIGYFDANGTAYGPLGAAVKPGWNTYEWTPPSTAKFPLKLSSFQVIETGAANQKDGYVIFDKLEVDNSAEVESPAIPDLEPDPLFSVDGKAEGDWSFATLSDIQFTAASPELAKTGIAALNRIRATNPDFVVLNGDITDQGGVADLKLARTTLETGGCDLIPAGGAEDSNPSTIPCYYVPGNHESYTASGQGTLDNWKAEFGAPYRTFDHKGTRFILLNSTLGTLRTSDFAQLPMLDAALKSAATDSSIDNVMVFAHHPVDDPAETDASQLTDRTEVQLVEKLLTDFREQSDKGAAMVGSHAQIADVHRLEGIPYIVLPSSGKAPYGTPDRGGFTGWMRWTVDRSEKASQQWITADVRAFAQSATLTAPEALEVGDSTQLEGSIVQPSGVLPGSRVVPLRYPMSVRWSGSENLAIGTDAAAAKAAGKAAILDPATRKLTALKSGEVTVTVTVDSMREYTGAESMAPITTSRVIKTQVTKVGADTPIGGTVPATLALNLGAPVSFGAFTPGVTKTYEQTSTATVVSTAGDATLMVSEPGFLTNGAFKLAKPLQVSGLPKAYSGPVTNDVATIGFKQDIAANDPLRTGSYTTTLTFTLSTTQP
ncbi:phosphodiester glycosidase family protein [Solirubrobacter phytolaccae]|uniref:Phosphodiester glycosidase family protein n=1 Tax=Solirubrobacter phytolaccae TaxID=1404360 RepID=A0A9X3SIU6_9ACTN|nr:phosphodiester glycosidase family protein [Solirubrobacter phytolaccae]MDA0184547.1 phosphodiester glycosidase family protein [Solirubrobacter phytolaccae]